MSTLTYRWVDILRHVYHITYCDASSSSAFSISLLPWILFLCFHQPQRPEAMRISMYKMNITVRPVLSLESTILIINMNEDCCIVLLWCRLYFWMFWLLIVKKISKATSYWQPSPSPPPKQMNLKWHTFRRYLSHARWYPCLTTLRVLRDTIH